MGVDKAVWASVRRAHDKTDESIRAFCARLGVAQSTYYRRRQQERWPKRGRTKYSLQQPNSPNLSEEAGQATVQTPRSQVLAGQRTPAQKRLTKRLYAAIDQELQQLETSVAKGGMDSVSDIERRTRTLMNMIRGFEKVLELDTDTGQPKRRSGKRDGTELHNDAERMRDEIAQRLERLHARRQDQERSGGARSGDS